MRRVGDERDFALAGEASIWMGAGLADVGDVADFDQAGFCGRNGEVGDGLRIIAMAAGRAKPDVVELADLIVGESRRRLAADEDAEGGGNGLDVDAQVLARSRLISTRISGCGGRGWCRRRSIRAQGGAFR